MINKNSSNNNNNDGKKEGEGKKSMPKDITIREFVQLAISQNPLVYKRLAEI
jgi:hypothetical protein